MRWETVEQILRVIEVSDQRFSQGYGIDQSYQYAVTRVSQEYGVKYQTIGDACRRRLGLDNIGEFKAILKDTLQGDPSNLQKLILPRMAVSYRESIDEFFSKLKNRGPAIKGKSKDTNVRYTVQLRKADSDILKALAQLLGRQPEEILAEIAMEAVKHRMKQAVSQL